jgi:hypothetical protein
MLNSREDCFKSVEAALEMTHFGRAISEAEGLVDVHVLLDWGVEERNVDVKMAQFKVAGGRDGKEEATVGHADYMRERFRIVEADALAASFGDESCFEAGDIANDVGLDFVDPYVVNDHVVRGKIDEFPRAVVYEGGVLMHRGLPLGGMGVVHGSPILYGFHTLSGGEESDGSK